MKFDHSYVFLSKYPHPCKIKNGKCCAENFGTYTKFMGQNLLAMMKVMRFAVGRGRSSMNITKLIRNVEKWNKYPMNPEKNEYQDASSMIPICNLNRADQLGCNLFDPIITDIGICHSFNPTQTQHLLKPSYFKESFNEAFKEDLNTNEIIHNGTGSGEDHSLTLYLFDSSFRRLRKGYQIPYAFQMLMSSKNNYFNMKRESQRVKPGYNILWKVQALEVIPSEDLQDVPYRKRKCKFSHEVEGMDSFNVYSQTACEFDCQIKKAFEFCQCYPWFIPPKAGKTRHVLCDVDGNLCFDSVMSNKEVIEECTCLPTCHNIEFTYVEYSSPLQLHCKTNAPPKVERDLIDRMIQNGYNSFTHIFLNGTKWEPYWQEYDGNLRPLCKEIEKYLSKVTIMFDKKTYIRSRTNVKVTFTDKLAAFGKTFIIDFFTQLILNLLSFII